MLNQMVAVAELEAGLISARTKAALASKKRFYEGLSDDERAALAAQGKATQLGGFRGRAATEEDRAAAIAAVKAKAKARTVDLASVIAGIQAEGTTSARGIAIALNERGIETATGKGQWQAVQVQRVRARLPA
jgi:hypothetical protein